MIQLEISNGDISIKNLKIEQLQKVLDWYNSIEDFRFATGIEEDIAIDFVKQKFIEAAISKDEFFAGIFQGNILIGVIKGNIRHWGNGILWINSLIIEKNSRLRGFGTKALELVVDDFKKNRQLKYVYISVLEENVSGLKFWEKNGFLRVSKLSELIKLNLKIGEAVIMNKEI